MLLSNSSTRALEADDLYSGCSPALNGASGLAQPRRQIETLGDLCREAAIQLGDDWRGIERYVTDRVRRLPVEQRQALLEDVLMTLRVQPPGRFRT
jgi:hypothetical protein